MEHPPRASAACLSSVLILFVLVLPFGGDEACAEETGRWIVVTAPALREAVAPLVEARRAGGFEVVEVAVEAEGPRLRARLADLCRDAKGTCVLLLVGSARAVDGVEEDAVVPMLEGRFGRMQGQRTDNGYGCLGEDPMPNVAVGRFPARTEDEAKGMVEKTLRFEAAATTSARETAWRDRLTLLVGHPGGSSKIERRMASSIVKSAVGSGFAKVHARWRPQAIVHMEVSPFCVPDAELARVSRNTLEGGQMFSFYLGHSGASGLASSGLRFLTRDDWAAMTSRGPNGVFVSCGCYAMQVDGFSGEGHGFAAMRNPNGPVAVIGAHGESYGAMGKLAFEGLVSLLEKDEPPVRLADWWMATKRGLAEGKIGPLTFLLYDRADGSNGRVPLADQRREHLEMWTLLGDPALRLPIPPFAIDLAIEGTVREGTAITVRGTIAGPLPAGTWPVEVVIERPFGSEPLSLPPLPGPAGAARDAVLLQRYALANDVVVASARTISEDASFACRIELPADLPWPRIVVRASARVGKTKPTGASSVATTK